MSVKLKLCPLCKSKANRLQNIDLYIGWDEIFKKAYGVGCVSCTAMVVGKTEKEADETWNRRAR